MESTVSPLLPLGGPEPQSAQVEDSTEAGKTDSAVSKQEEVLKDTKDSGTPRVMRAFKDSVNTHTHTHSCFWHRKPEFVS